MQQIEPCIGRRHVLVGLAAGALVAACGRGSQSSTAPPIILGEADPVGWRLGARFADGYTAPSSIVAGSLQRAPYVLLGVDGLPIDTEGPQRLDFTIREAGPGGTVVATHTVERHGGEPATPYFPLVFQINDPGDYVVQIDNKSEPHNLRVIDVDQTELLQVGDPLPAIVTPTIADPQDVDPICTETNGPCPFHEHSVVDALARPGPTALLVSTPRFCQSDVCGPTVGLLRSSLRVRPEPWSVVHAEVYQGPEAGNFNTTPVVTALGLNFEPTLIVANSAGIVTAALHFTMDANEVAAAMKTAV